MEEALELARLAGERDEVPVGALLVCEGEVLARGSNDRERSGRAVAHAEIEALDEYSAQTGQWRVPPGTSLIVTVEPCLMCTGALLWARVENIYYGCADPRRAGLQTVLPLIEAGRFDHRFKRVEGGLLEERSAALMKEFFRRKRESSGDKTDEETINQLIERPCGLSTPG
jgi:tRNA(adenine34) deaminase